MLLTELERAVALRPAKPSVRLALAGAHCLEHPCS